MFWLALGRLFPGLRGNGLLQDGSVQQMPTAGALKTLRRTMSAAGSIPGKQRNNVWMLDTYNRLAYKIDTTGGAAGVGAVTGVYKTRPTGA